MILSAIGKYCSDIETFYDINITCVIITLFKSITMLCGTDNIPCSILGFSPHRYPGILRGILLVPRNIVMDMNNFMIVSLTLIWGICYVTLMINNFTMSVDS